MNDMLLPYLFGTLTTGVILFLSVFNYLRGKQERLLYEAERAKLPSAVRLEKLEELRRQSEEEFLQINKQLSAARSLLDEKEESQRWLEENRDKLLQLKADREQQESIRKTLETTEARIESAQSKLQDLNVEVAKQVAQIEHWNQQKQQVEKELKDTRNEKAALREALESLENDIQPLRNTLAGINQSIEAKNEEMRLVSAQMQNRVSQYEDQIQQNKELYERAESRLGEITDEMAGVKTELETLRDQRSTVSADVHALEREKVALEDLIKNLRSDWNTVLRLTGQDEDADHRRTQELWSPYFSNRARDFDLLSDTTELELLTNTSRYLESEQLYFPQRVLYAFHTSLKVTDISPLVVLAGISGTGKSELPRRYADAMGIHFLNVAVQPRWDSPQDMFGFFNYLESRYRATELGRALVQMDPYYTEENRGWAAPEDWDNSLSSQLLLVLLDEMNLARVEYYFSEFLSRLETRRGIDVNDPQSRKKAEIGLEVGSGRSTAPIMQLFVDRNVLFVGTMNEDETTQALSDKVVDRANVLRFGRPGNVVPDKAAKFTLEPNKRLSYHDWQSWCKSSNEVSDDVRLTVNQYVDRLDNAMAKIKRPFGFRTRNGILSYVANYPSQDADAIEDAVADQIEQKILPKFRGLDPRDHDTKAALGMVRSVLSDLGDALLVEAIDRTAKESQFIWLGVNRFSEELGHNISSASL